VDRNNPTIWINLHISNNRAVLALDAAGGPLHKRGYRKEGLEAPIQETLAAAIIRISEYDGSQPIFDPMCGSGTLLAEALMVGRRLPPATLRNRFGFQSFPDYDNSTWRRIRTAADDEAGPFPTGGISGGDKDKGAIYGARKNLDMIPGGKRVKLVQADLASHVLTEPTLIVTNPPYGLRLDPDKDLSPFYKRLGDWMKQNCAGSTAYIYFGDRKYLKSIGLRSKWKLPLRNGGLDGRLARFDLY
jgi:putative N6-adenine-specific DNA methylase